MAKKHTKAERLQSNAERLDRREEASRESEINDQRSELASGNTDVRTLEERVRLRAYELFEARGREHGRDLDDWLQAEAEIIGSKKIVTDAQRKAAAA
jgi:Protein of unknown function (DUF2934)